MDGILEQILSELKEIKLLLKENMGKDTSATNSTSVMNTMKTKEAAEYLGITEWQLRILTKQGKIQHFKAGNRFLYKRKSLDLWLENELTSSVEQKDDEDIRQGRIRKIKA
jgi:excisionase family DNA binding protein